MEIPSVPADIIARDRMGNKVLIEADVCNIVADLQRIDSNLKVRWSEAGEYFVVYHETPRGDGSTEQKLVLTSYEFDKRIVKRVEQISHSSYDYTKELEKAEAQGKRDREHKFNEQVGDIGQKLAHAIRKDLGEKTDAQRQADLRRNGGSKD